MFGQCCCFEEEPAPLQPEEEDPEEPEVLEVLEAGVLEALVRAEVVAPPKTGEADPEEPEVLEAGEALALPRLFACAMRREGKLGFTCASHPRSLEVTKLREEGSAHKYNADAPEKERLAVGDHIIAVNGERDIKKLLGEMREKASLTFEVIRPLRFQAVLTRIEGPLGIKVRCNPGDASVHVTSIPPGSFEKYNDFAPDETKVKVHDYVVGFDGKSGSAKLIADRMSAPRSVSAQEQEICILRLGI